MTKYPKKSPQIVSNNPAAGFESATLSIAESGDNYLLTVSGTLLAKDQDYEVVAFSTNIVLDSTIVGNGVSGTRISGSGVTASTSYLERNGVIRIRGNSNTQTNVAYSVRFTIPKKALYIN